MPLNRLRRSVKVERTKEEVVEGGRCLESRVLDFPGVGHLVTKMRAFLGGVCGFSGCDWEEAMVAKVYLC